MQQTNKIVIFERGQAFEVLKQKLVSRPILAICNSYAETELHANASQLGIGGSMLHMQQDKSLRPIMYFGRQTTKEEQCYYSYELEILAVDSLKFIS